MVKPVEPEALLRLLAEYAAELEAKRAPIGAGGSGKEGGAPPPS
jgi:hypothetical protein